MREPSKASRHNCSPWSRNAACPRRGVRDSADGSPRSKEAYERDRRSFKTWRSARAVTEQTSENPAVLARARQLDAQLAAQRDLAREERQLGGQQRDLEEKIVPLEARLNRLEREAQQRYERAHQRQERIAFLISSSPYALPVLLLSIALFRRQRLTEQWPFAWGLLLFGVLVFFVELVPYLPSFGGSISYGIGALLTLFWGVVRSSPDYARNLERK